MLCVSCLVNEYVYTFNVFISCFRTRGSARARRRGPAERPPLESQGPRGAVLLGTTLRRGDLGELLPRKASEGLRKARLARLIAPFLPSTTPMSSRRTSPSSRRRIDSMLSSDPSISLDPPLAASESRSLARLGKYWRRMKRKTLRPATKIRNARLRKRRWRMTWDMACRDRLRDSSLTNARGWWPLP